MMSYSEGIYYRVKKEFSLGERVWIRIPHLLGFIDNVTCGRITKICFYFDEYRHQRISYEINGFYECSCRQIFTNRKAAVKAAKRLEKKTEDVWKAI